MDIRAKREAAGVTQAALARAAAVAQPNLSAYENGRRTPSPDVVERIRQALRNRPSDLIERHREAMRTLVAEHHGSAPRLFGSVARGSDDLDSDIDLLVDFDEEARLFDEIALRLALSDLLGVTVDVVGSDALRGGFQDRVLAEAVPL